MPAAIEIRDVTVRFPSRRGSVTALDGLTLSVDSGHVFGFLGPNGAGKTTTMHVLLGFIGATAGTARVLGDDVRRIPARRRIGYLPEHPQLYPFLSARELLTMAGRLFRIAPAVLRARIPDLLRTVGLEDAADRRIATYSRGMLQRAGLAQALVNDPELVILDEPTGGLDPFGRLAIREIINSLRDRGKTVFFSSHELSEAELVCDELAILAGGRLVTAGRADALIPRGENLERFFYDTVSRAASGPPPAAGRKPPG
ncbi:MAG: ABC transporter ATP-binding protein [Lentisphaerae bacterium]|nr:ABC transporter ATP-binding protein [Lentisphaerota bacterium]